MRYPKDQKADTKRHILEVAARSFRAKGPDHVSVGEVMSEAGLTHGGFYAHFKSKDALVAESVAVMFSDARSRTSPLDHALAGAESDVRDALLRYCRSYLSSSHRDRPERGCPLPSLSADVARKGGAAADALARGLGAMSDRMARVLNRIGEDDAINKATAIVAQMVGAITLARTLGQTPESDKLLNACYDDFARRYGA